MHVYADFLFKNYLNKVSRLRCITDFLSPSHQDQLNLHTKAKQIGKVIPFISVMLMTDTWCHDQIDHRMVSINLCNSRIEQISCAVARSFHLL